MAIITYLVGLLKITQDGWREKYEKSKPNEFRKNFEKPGKTTPSAEWHPFLLPRRRMEHAIHFHKSHVMRGVCDDDATSVNVSNRPQRLD
jgi:hypothetical protein